MCGQIIRSTILKEVRASGPFSTMASLETPAKVLPAIDGDFSPNIKQLLMIACTLAVTSCECERSIDRLRCLKTYLRNTMKEDRLNGLAMLYIHRDIPCKAEDVVYEFARRHPRRMQLINPLCSTEGEQ